jgi:hypothetical protein
MGGEKMRKNQNQDEKLIFAWDNYSNFSSSDPNFFYFEDLFFLKGKFLLKTSFGQTFLSKSEAIRWLQEKTKMGEKECQIFLG